MPIAKLNRGIRKLTGRQLTDNAKSRMDSARGCKTGLRSGNRGRKTETGYETNGKSFFNPAAQITRTYDKSGLRTKKKP